MIANSIKGIFRNKWLVLTLRLFLGCIFVASSIFAAPVLTPSPSAVVKADTPYDSSVPCSICSGSSIDPTNPDAEWSSKPVIVNIQVDLEKEGDQEYVYDILDQIELRNWRTTVFVTGEFAAAHPDIIRSIESRGHQIGVHGWQEGEDLTLLSYAEQLSLISKAFAAVRGPVSKPEEVVDFKPQGYKFNDDTIRIAQELGAKSVSGIFTCQEPFCKCPYAQKLGKITFPYPVTNNFWLVPISEVKIDSSDTPLDDEYIDNPQEFLDYLIGKYSEQLQTKDPLIIAVHPSITGADAAKLNALSQFVEYVTNNNGRIKPLSSLTHLTAYIPSLQITSAPQSANPGGTVTITVQFSAAIYCPSYYFRIYGKYPSESYWTLKAEHYHGVQTGTFSFSRSFAIPEPPAGDSSYTIRVVGQACSGTCWPTPYSYERMDETEIDVSGLILPLTEPVVSFWKLFAQEYEQRMQELNAGWILLDSLSVGYVIGALAIGATVCVPCFMAGVITMYVKLGLDTFAYIMADPPDGNFREVVAVETVTPVPPYDDSSLAYATATLATKLLQQNAILEAVLVTIERLQGAEEANELTYVTLQAEALREFSLLLMSNQQEVREAFTLLGTELVAGVEPVYDEMKNELTRLSVEGLSPEERELLQEAGISLDEIQTIEDILQALDVQDGFHNDLKVALDLFADYIGEVILPALEQGVEDIDALLEFIHSLTSIHGTVIDNNGNPAPDVYIYAIGPTTTSTVTDISGSYNITGLQSGSYIIRVEPLSPNLMLTSTSIVINAGQTIILDFILQTVGSIAGNITDEDGTAIPNLYVYLTGYETARYRTDDSGHYVIPRLQAGTYTVNVDASETIFTDASATVGVVLGQTTALDFLLPVFQGGQIAGRVTDEDGDGVYNARVSVSGPSWSSGYTNATGYYFIPRLLAGSYAVAVEPPHEVNLVPTSTTAEVVQGETTTVDFVLQAGGIIAGRVTDEEGEGLSWAYVYASGPSYRSGYTDEDGYYSITGLQGGTYTVTAEPPYGVNLVRGSTTAEVMQGETTTVDFVLQAGGMITGRVTDEGDVGVFDAYIYADGPGYGYGYADEEGYYTILGLASGIYTVTAEPPYGVNLIRSSTTAEVTQGETTVVDFILQAGGMITGRVTDETDVGVSDAHIYASGPGYGYGYADEDGYYTIFGLQDGTYTVTAYPPYAVNLIRSSTTAEVIQGETTIVDFVLETGGTISGHVYQADGTTPIAEADIYAELVDGGYGMWAMTASDGSYTIRGLVSGSYRVRAYAEGYIREYYNNVYSYSEATLVSVTAPSDTPNIDFTLDVGGTISGHVYQADGTTPIEGAWVYANLVDDGYGMGATTAPDGSYTITGLVTGQYRVRAYAEEYIWQYYDGVYDYSEATPVSVTMPDDTPNIDFTLDLGGTISGHVYQSDSTTPIEGAWVYANLVDGGYVMGATTAPDGSYTITGLVTGQYRVRAYAEEYIWQYYDGVYDYSEATPVSVTMPDDTPNIDFTLDLGGTISGHVYQSDGTTPIEGAWVYANLVDGGYGMGATTAPDGSYTITGLITGQYRVEAHPPYGVNWVPGSTTAEVIQGETTIVNFILQVGGMITGRASDEAGAGVCDARIYASGPGYGHGHADEEGYYTIVGLPTGTYIVEAYPPYGVNLVPGSTTAEVIQGETTTVDFVLQAGGMITGRVTDEADVGVSDAHIYASGPGYRHGYADEDGYYTIFGLPSGNYTVEAFPPYGVNLIPSSTTAEVIQGETTTVDFVLQACGIIDVTSEPSGISFNLNGPQNYSGTTPWSMSNAPIGTYTITWGPMEGYKTPDPETKALVQDGTTSFHGVYQPIPVLTMHVGGIEMNLVSSRWITRATATITIVDANGSPVAGARVYGHWEDATHDTDSKRTKRQGKITLRSDRIRRAPSSTTFTFVVDSVVKAGWTYDPNTNVETGDSISVP